MTHRRIMPLRARRGPLVALALALALGSLLPSGPARAEAQAWEIDAVHSGINFQIRHFFAMVPGRFGSFNGTLIFDEQNPATGATIEFTIDAASVTTDNEKRDGHLKSADFFNVEKFPTLTFKSTKIEKGAEAGHFNVTGDFTMLGVTKPVTVQAELIGVGPDAWGGTRGGFTVTGVVNRKDFGMVWNKTLDNGGTMLSDEVKFTANLEVVKKKA